jgi:hypothetical protein
MAPQREPESRDTDELIDESRLPTNPNEVNQWLMERTQNMTRPVWIRVWRRRGLMHALDRHVEAPYRRGELALVISKLETVQLGEKSESCIKLQYADKAGASYPKVVMLPIMEYVWTDKTDGQVRLMYVDREDDD